MSFLKQSTSVFISALLILFSLQSADAQKVGVVLSGGAASGIAHIGVLKVLNNRLRSVL
jgi:predicted acylesterase/phospholipase RssA